MSKIIAPLNTIFAQNSFSDTIFYDIVGNFIPPEWKNLTSSSGKVLSKTARQILSLVVSLMPCEEDKAEEVEKTGINPSNELQETYYYFEKMIGLCQRRIRQCLVELEQSGYIKLNVTTIVKEYIKYHNIICISLAKNFAPYPQKFLAQPEKVFGYTRNNFHPLHIIDNNKSKSISRSRYEEASFENEKLAAAIENAAANNQDLQQDSSIANTDVGNEELDNVEIGFVSKVVNTAKTWWGMKKAEEFHPLTEEDAEKLRLMSGREYNLSFINKLLLKLSKYQPNNRFNTKERLLNYMAKALTNEKRDPNLANNESFSCEYDYKTQKIEKYLKEVEYSGDTSMYAQLRRKIAAVFERDDAYNLLQACLFSEEIEKEEYILKLKYNISLSEHAKKTLLSQIQAVYGAKKVKRLRVIYASNAKEVVKQKQEITKKEQQEISVESYIETALAGLDPIWCKVREYLINYCGKTADMAWFSKLELVKKDETNNKIFLKPQTAFIGSRITANYFIHLKLAFESFNYSYELVKA